MSSGQLHPHHSATGGPNVSSERSPDRSLFLLAATNHVSARHFGMGLDKGSYIYSSGSVRCTRVLPLQRDLNPPQHFHLSRAFWRVSHATGQHPLHHVSTLTTARSVVSRSGVQHSLKGTAHKRDTHAKTNSSSQGSHSQARTL